MTESASEGGFFKQNRLLRVCEGLDGFGLMAEGERLALLRYFVSLLSLLGREQTNTSLPEQSKTWLLPYHLHSPLISSYLHSSLHSVSQH